jgi:MoxR-like ATPase
MKRIGDETKKWILDALSRGYRDSEIKELLLDNGYKILDIKKSIEEVKSSKDFGKNLNFDESVKSDMPSFEELKETIGEKKIKPLPVTKISPERDKREINKIASRVLHREKKPEVDSEFSQEVKEVSRLLELVRHEISKSLIGQKETVNAVLCAILCNGHVLLEGVPGIAKTLLVKSMSDALGSESKRIQFTVDLLPSDITGITTYTPERGFETIKGPIFANFLLADEINRSPPKTQSALIESMQEKQVTIAKETYKLPQPFFVMATENPLESSGVYDLPEAQVDRFLFKLIVGYPESPEDEKKIMDTNMTTKKFEDFGIQPVLNPNKIIRMQGVVKKVYMDDKIKDYIVKIVHKTRKKDFNYGEFVDWGGSPRATIALFIASKAWALMQGRTYVIPEDVRKISHYVLRHRIILNYKAHAEGITSDKVIDEILSIISI